MVEVVPGLLLVDILRTDTWALLVLADHLAEVAVPLEGFTVLAYVVTGIDDVDEPGDGILVSLVGTVLLHVVQMPLISLVEAVGSGFARSAEASLTATDIDK